MKRAQLLLILVVLDVSPVFAQKDYLKETKTEKDQRLLYQQGYTKKNP
jgi:hypothetical protein